MATAQQYLAIFQGHQDGAAILEDLMAQHYDGNIFLPGNTEGTFMNLGAREVVRRILRKIASAQGGDPNELEPDHNAEEPPS
jgi:hypothetical protein